ELTVFFINQFRIFRNTSGITVFLTGKMSEREHKLLLYSGVYDRNPSEQPAEMRDFPPTQSGKILMNHKHHIAE
ncbi:MAG TPA: hypothetical protein DCQ37_22335, partial [Desulfobacteraceae bacterium]|nr:hypothetical protein [Desulfobacteraceae bacterium]